MLLLLQLLLLYLRFPAHYMLRGQSVLCNHLSMCSVAHMAAAWHCILYTTNAACSKVLP